MQVFLNPAQVGGEWLASRPCCFTPKESAPGIQSIGGWIIWTNEKNCWPFWVSNSELLFFKLVDRWASLNNREKWKFFTLQGLETGQLFLVARENSLNTVNTVTATTIWVAVEAWKLDKSYVRTLIMSENPTSRSSNVCKVFGILGRIKWL
jgi:hypothetical protein